jgi:hypothetical protein
VFVSHHPLGLLLRRTVVRASANREAVRGERNVLRCTSMKIAIAVGVRHSFAPQRIPAEWIRAQQGITLASSVEFRLPSLGAEQGIARALSVRCRRWTTSYVTVVWAPEAPGRQFIRTAARANATRLIA